jgi:hypothetical protein
MARRLADAFAIVADLRAGTGALLTRAAAAVRRAARFAGALRRAACGRLLGLFLLFLLLALGRRVLPRTRDGNQARQHTRQSGDQATAGRRFRKGAEKESEAVSIHRVPRGVGMSQDGIATSMDRRGGERMSNLRNERAVTERENSRGSAIDDQRSALGSPTTNDRLPPPISYGLRVNIASFPDARVMSPPLPAPCTDRGHG